MPQISFAYAICAIGLISLEFKPIGAQTVCDSSSYVRASELVGIAADYARLMELDTAGPITPRLARRLSNPVTPGCAVGPWRWERRSVEKLNSALTVAPFSMFMTLNSAYPEDRNNGALWSGRGISMAVDGGAVLKLGPLTVAALPILTYQQNRRYTTLPSAVAAQSIYSSGLYSALDLPQRFGPNPYSRVNPGNSYVRVEVGRFGMGVSNENVWWGPGISNAILFTNTAPGFPHAFFNIGKPLNVGLGQLTGELLWGKLSESQYFDTVTVNDHRLIVGALLALEPGWVPGLSLGIGRTFVVPWDSVDARNLFPFGQAFWKRNVVSPTNPNGSNDDQRVSLMARYVLPASGFEVYGEWAREDHSWDATDFVEEPEHSSAHILGFQKVFAPRNARWVRVYAELTNLQQLRQNRPGVRSTPRFYVHAPQGHTHLGQLLGASIGPGSESQLLGIDVLGTRGLLGAFIERVRRDEFSALAIQAWSTSWPPKHDVAISPGLRVTRAVGSLQIDAQLSRSWRYNRNFIRNESNVGGQLRLIWSASK